MITAAELYQREGTSPLAGFAPLIVQWPVFSVLYLLFRSPAVAGGPNLLLSRTLLGVPLGSHWLSAAGTFSVHGAVFAGVLAVLAAACWAVARAARRALPVAGGSATAGAGGPGTAGANKALAVVGRVAPYLTVVIAAFAPLAVVIYLVTSTSWSAAERLAFAARAHRSTAAASGATRRELRAPSPAGRGGTGKG